MHSPIRPRAHQATTSCTVLITGFGPFPGAPFNPTEVLVQRLGARRRPALADIRRIVHVFHTSYAVVDRELPDLLARHQPDVLLMFGLATRTPFLRVEMRARNALSRLVPDAGGRRMKGACIRPGAAAARSGRAPFQKLVSAARAVRVPTRLSRNAGAYLCNYVYWHASEAKPRRRQIPIVVFVHVPLVGLKPRAWGARRRLSLADLNRAGEAILLALVAAARTARH